MKKLFILTVVSFLITSCTVFGNTRCQTSLEAELGLETYQAIQNAQSIVITGVEHSRKPPFVVNTPEFTAGPYEKATLIHALLNESHYIFGRKKRAIFIPSWKLVFSGKQSVTIYISNSSQELLVKAPGKDIYLNDDPMAARLNELMTKISGIGA